MLADLPRLQKLRTIKTKLEQAKSTWTMNGG